MGIFLINTESYVVPQGSDLGSLLFILVADNLKTKNIE